MGLKADDAFLRFITLGSAGTAATALDLRDHRGHQPIELERLAMANKRWGTKVKRLRIPDLLCVRCGRRIESKAKNKMMMSLSDSSRPDRSWNDGGMRDDDLFSFIFAEIASDDTVVVGQPQYFTTGALKDALGHAKTSDPKAASEGSEIQIRWPATVPGKPGQVLEVVGSKIMCLYPGGRRQTFRRSEDDFQIYCTPGEVFGPYDTLLAGVVRPPTNLRCPGETWDVAAALDSADATSSYSAIKALRCRPDLHSLLDHAEYLAAAPDTDWRLRLEAVASLAAVAPTDWTPTLGKLVTDSSAHQEQRIEATLALAELATAEAAETLADIATDTLMPTDVRAAATWGLGLGSHPAPDVLVELTVDDDRNVAIHAFAALPELSDTATQTLLAWLDLDDRRAATAARLLARHNKVHELADAAIGLGPARTWAVNILGRVRREDVKRVLHQPMSPELLVHLEIGWANQRDWLKGTDELADVADLDGQKVRHDPFTLDPPSGVGVPRVKTAPHPAPSGPTQSSLPIAEET